MIIIQSLFMIHLKQHIDRMFFFNILLYEMLFFFLVYSNFQMEYLNKIGSGQTGPTFGVLNSLTVDERYPIEQWIALVTKFGRQIQVQIKGEYYFLPRRFNTLTDAELERYNVKQIYLIYKGHRNFGNCPPTAIVEFVEC